MSESTESMDWDAAKEHFVRVRQTYLDSDGVPGINVRFALTMTFDPMGRRYNSGERTRELYEAMMSVE